MEVDESSTDPICSLCSKPVASGSVVVFERGRLFHVRCRSRELELTAMQNLERAERLKSQAAATVEEVTRRRASSTPRGVATCPLCGNLATITDWRPTHLAWVVVEGCPCGDYFVSAALFEHRLARLSEAERHTLASRVRWFRAKGAEAWCTTPNGSVDGPLDIRERRAL
jgi:hypothetical protein